MLADGNQDVLVHLGIPLHGLTADHDDVLSEDGIVMCRAGRKVVVIETMNDCGKSLMKREKTKKKRGERKEGRRQERGMYVKADEQGS